MKHLKELTQDEYKKLKKSDMLTILYPEATGDYEKDCKSKDESPCVAFFKKGEWINIGGSVSRCYDNMTITYPATNICRRATIKEIQDYLIAEAKKKYSVGDTLNVMQNGEYGQLVKYDFEYDEEEDSLLFWFHDRRYRIYMKGEWAVVRSKLESKPTYKVGDWVEYILTSNIFANEVRTGRITSERIAGIYVIDNKISAWEQHILKKLNHSEIETFLIEEAKRRGYKKGVSILDRRSNSTVCTITSPHFDYKYNPTLDRLYTIILGRNNMYDAVIYSKGEWAEIINYEAIKIGGYDVEFESNGIKVGCKHIDKYDLGRLKSFYQLVGKLGIESMEVMPQHNTIHIFHESVDHKFEVNIDTLQKILDKLND